MTIATDIILRALNLFTYQKIWNEIASEYYVNLQLYPASTRFCVNILIGEPSLALPTTGQQYGVFFIDYPLFGNSLIIPKDTWVSTDVLANVHDTCFHAYTTTGMMVQKSAVYLYHRKANNRVYVAIAKAQLVAASGIANWSSMYISVFRYLQATPTPITVQSISVPNPDTGQVVTAQAQAAVTAARAISQAGTFLYINGFDRSADTTPVINPGDYIDIYVDRTVVGSYTVDLTTTVTGYYSSKYACYKDVLHMPKSVNPNKNIVTPELLTITARRNSDNVGAYLSHNATNCVTQITHCDHGVNSEVLDAYRNTLGTQDISIEVKFRIHDRTLIRDSSYIDYLYILTDAQILTFLSGHGNSSLPWWSAAALEQTAYIGYMFATPALLSAQGLAGYVAGLGYYTVLSVLCQHKKEFVVDQIPVTNLNVKKPLILCGTPAYPVVYVNGVKARATYVDYANTHQDEVVIGLINNIYVQPNDKLTVELVETGSASPYIFTPTAQKPFLNVPFTSVTVFQVNTLDTPVQGYGTTSSTSYTPITLQEFGAVQTAPDTALGGVDVIFTSACYGKQYIIQNGTFSMLQAADISQQVTNNQPLSLVLNTIAVDNETVLPLLGYQTLDVFLNGKRLVKGLDYSASPWADPQGNPSIVQVMLCNRSCLNLTGGTNYLEVLAHTAVRIGEEVGFVANNMIDIQNNSELYYNGMTDVFAGGRLQINPGDGGNFIQPNPPVDTGLPFAVSAKVPGATLTVLAPYTSTADDTRIATINTFLNEQPLINDLSTVIVDQSWEVFSPYLQAIIHDASQPGVVELWAQDPDPVRFNAQFASYAYLLANDPTVTQTGTTGPLSHVDIRFCDIYPCYAQVGVPDITTYNVIHQLAANLLPADSETLGEVVNA